MGVCFRCSACKSRRGIYSDSNFEDSPIKPSQLIVLLFHFAQDSGARSMAQEAGVSYDYALRVATRCRILINIVLEEEDVPLGGQDQVVEIDECEYGRKRKGLHGRVAATKLDACGVLERSTGKVILRSFEKLNEDASARRQKGPASASEVLPLVRDYVAPFSIVASDRLRAYRSNLRHMGYKWFGVNHSVGEFVIEGVAEARGARRPLPVHSQSIDSIWRHLKHWMMTRARRQEDYPAYLLEWQWRHNCKVTGTCPYKALISFMSENPW